MVGESQTKRKEQNRKETNVYSQNRKETNALLTGTEKRLMHTHGCVLAQRGVTPNQQPLPLTSVTNETRGKGKKEQRAKMTLFMHKALLTAACSPSAE
jgi:hypothetical protein